MSSAGENKAAATAQALTVNPKRGSVAVPAVGKDRSTDGSKKGSQDIAAESPKKEPAKKAKK
jgi:hypothetical protein